MLKIKNLCMKFDNKEVLKNINLDVKKGDRIVIIGPSGSGKSTILRCINRMIEPSSGEISFNNVKLDNKNISEYRQKIGMVFQNFNLFNNLSVMDNIILAPVKLNKYSLEDAKVKAIKLLEKINLLDKKDEYPKNLSGGQQQRVAIVRSLIMNPDMILFDEPTSALDPEMVNEVQDMMIDLANDGMTMIVVTHEISFIKKVATKIVFINEGKIIFSGNYDEIKKCDNATVKLFLSNIKD